MGISKIISTTFYYFSKSTFQILGLIYLPFLFGNETHIRILLWRIQLQWVFYGKFARGKILGLSSYI